MYRKKLIIYSVIFCLLSYLLVDVFIYFKFKDEQTVKALNHAIEVYSKFPGDSIPENIIQAYNKVFPKSVKNRIYPDALWIIYSLTQRQSYVQIDLAYELGHNSGLKLVSLANQLDNTLTRRQCIYAYLSRFDFLNNAIGIKQAAKFYYNKNMQDLNERECLELMIMTKNPAKFNKIRHQVALDREIKKLLN